MLLRKTAQFATPPLRNALIGGNIHSCCLRVQVAGGDRSVPGSSQNDIQQIITKSHYSILLVEDSSDDAFFFKRVLKKAAFAGHLEHAMDGRAAIRYLAAHEKQLPLLAFIDLKMPVMSGFEVLEWIQEKEFSRDLTRVVLSGSDDKSDRERAASLGAADYLVKPIMLEMLVLQLKKVEARMIKPKAGRIGQ